MLAMGVYLSVNQRVALPAACLDARTRLTWRTPAGRCNATVSTCIFVCGKAVHDPLSPLGNAPAPLPLRKPSRPRLPHRRQRRP